MIHKKLWKCKRNSTRIFSQKKTIPIENSYFADMLDNLPSLSEELKKSLDSSFTLEELERVINKSKLNKSPGPSGFTNEFFKYFLCELSTWLLRTYQHSYNKGSLSRDTLMGTITCIPKGGKTKE